MYERLIEVINAISKKDLSSGGKTILNVLILYGKENNCGVRNIEISLKILEKCTGFSKRGIIKMIDSLKKKSLLSVKRQTGKKGHISNKYTLQIGYLRKLSKLNRSKNTGNSTETVSETLSKNNIGFLSMLSTPPLCTSLLPPSELVHYPPTPSKALVYNNLIGPHVSTNLRNLLLLNKIKNLNFKKTRPDQLSVGLDMLVLKHGENRVTKVMKAAQENSSIKNLKGWVYRALEKNWEIEEQRNYEN